jgi:hypothetical protein
LASCFSFKIEGYEEYSETESSVTG